ncbi:ferredoxin reductase [Aureimonas endophytica]|uniref:Ferredoxin reductase n=2 Tax=Aureimonas endophytica TaxID=2027858 RepID=A0A916ZLY2_9HYPH|nr:ferredoxin reductase [Aureimonas endophytica]
MSVSERGMVIVGAGECGVRAAFALREAGYEGPVHLVGDEPHLPYERPPLSKASDDGPSLKVIRDEQAFRDHAIRHMRGQAVARIDRDAREVEFADGTRLGYDALLLATGARARRLPMAAGLSRVHTLRSYDDALAMGARLRPGGHVTVVGGGFIGLEFAALARGRGVAVTLLEAAPRLLMRAVPAEVAEAVQALHEANGVDLRLGAAISGMTEDADAVHIGFADGTSFSADAVLVGIGAEPATELASAAGLVVENGIRVDRHLRTSDPSIFAAGDCCSFPLGQDGTHVRLESWRNAQEQGELAAKNMLGHGVEHSAVPWFWSDQYDHTLQIAGMATGTARTVRREIGDGAFLLFHLAETGRLVAVSGFGPGNSVARDVRLGEMMIARGLSPDPDQLEAPATKLKSLLAA